MRFRRRVQPREYILIYVRGEQRDWPLVYVGRRFPYPCPGDYGPAEKCKWPRVIYNDTKAASPLTGANVYNVGKIYNYYFIRGPVYISKDYSSASRLFIADETRDRLWIQ